jgi:hypothetical protein
MPQTQRPLRGRLTPATGGSPTRCISGRSARCAAHPAPAPTTSPYASAAPATRPPCGSSATASSASSTAASKPERPTTRPPPGRISNPALDIEKHGMSAADKARSRRSGWPGPLSRASRSAVAGVHPVQCGVAGGPHGATDSSPSSGVGYRGDRSSRDTVPARCRRGAIGLCGSTDTNRWPTVRGKIDFCRTVRVSGM